MEIPRRLASTGRAVAGIYPLTLDDLARAVAEPALLGRGLLRLGRRARRAAGGAPARRATRPRGSAAGRAPPPVAAALARTLSELRRAESTPTRLEARRRRGRDAGGPRAAARPGRPLPRRSTSASRDASPITRRSSAPRASTSARRAGWKGAEILVVDDLELDAVERRLLAALARAFPGPAAPPRSGRRRSAPPGFAGWAAAHGIREVEWAETRRWRRSLRRRRRPRSSA